MGRLALKERSPAMKITLKLLVANILTFSALVAGAGILNFGKKAPTEDEQIKAFVADVMSFAGETMKNDRIRNISVEHGGKVMYRDDRFVSYRAEKREKYSTPTPMKVSLAAGVYDLKRGRRLTHEDLFGSDTSHACDPVLMMLQNKGTTAERKQIAELETLKGRQRLFDLMKKNGFCFTSKGVLWVFGDGELTVRHRDVIVPWEKIRHFLNDDKLFAHFSDKE